MDFSKKILGYALIMLCLILSACDVKSAENTDDLNDSVKSVIAEIGLNPDRYLYPVFTDVQKMENIEYAEKADFKGIQQKLLLDLYEPANDDAKTRPVVLLAHGGSLFTGSKSDMAKFAEDFTKKGYVVISADYHLREDPVTDWNAAITDAVDDMASVYDWMMKNGAAYRLDTQHIAVGGESAGGALTLSFINAGERIWKERDKSSIFAVVNLYGPMSPSNDIDSEDPPVLFIHGTEDRTVDYNETLEMVSLHRNKGVYAELFTMEGEGHGTDKYWPDVLFEMTQFLHKTLTNQLNPALVIKDTPVVTSSRGDRFLITLERNSAGKGSVQAKVPAGWQAEARSTTDDVAQFEISVAPESPRDYYPVQFELVESEGKAQAATSLYVDLKDPLEITIKPQLSASDQEQLVCALVVRNRSNSAYSGTISLSTTGTPEQQVVLPSLQPGKSAVLETTFMEGDIHGDIKLMNGVHFTFSGYVDVHRYEAESAEISSAQLGTYPADSGGFHVGHMDSLNSSIEFQQVYAPAAGMYSMDILYSNGWGAETEQLLSVNNGEGITVQYPSTLQWGDIGSNQINIDLEKGMNKIRLNYSGQESTDIDAILITEAK